MNPISYLRASEQLDLNMHEWLSSYFDGAAHVLVSGTEPVPFPRARLGFGVSSLAQPLSGVGITTIAEIRQGGTYRGGGADKAPTDDSLDVVEFTFIVRAKVGPDQEGNSALACQQAKDLLEALLKCEDAKVPLARSGVFDLQWRRGGVVPVTEAAVREVKARARLGYSVGPS
jgi:hypothetical protein